MTLIARPLNPQFPDFAGEISGVDLNRPFAPDLAEQVMSAMDRFAVCVLRDQHIPDEQHVAFSRLFGDLETAPRYGTAPGKARQKLAELFDVSNLDENGELQKEDDRRRLYRLANEMWHTDSSFQPHGASYSLLRARVVPDSGADTEFIDMRAAYDALPQAMQERIAHRVAEHSTAHSRSVVGYKFDEREQILRRPTLQYLVQTHSRTGRKSLYIASHASHVIGMDRAEGRALLDELTALAAQTPSLYRHRWCVGDILIWDNRCTMHRATPFPEFEQKRDLCRTTVVGDLPLVA